MARGEQSLAAACAGGATVLTDPQACASRHLPRPGGDLFALSEFSNATKIGGEFYRNAARRDGLGVRCKDCDKKRKQTSAAREQARVYAQRSDVREARTAYQQSEAGRARRTRYFNSNHGRATLWAATYRQHCERVGVRPIFGEPLTPADVIANYGDGCYYREDGAFKHLDHHTPVSHGGSHTLGNVRPSCAACNRTKWTHLPRPRYLWEACLEQLQPLQS